MPPKRTAYCDLTEYIGDRNKELYELLQYTCVRDVLARGNVTFLFPTDATVKKLYEVVKSDDAEAIKTAREAILAHVIHGAHKTVEAPTPLNTRQSVPREIRLAKAADGIKIASGAGSRTTAMAKPAADFADSSARGNIAVYTIVSGEVAADGPTVDISKPRPTRGGVRGGYALEANRRDSLRFKIIMHLEQLLFTGQMMEFIKASCGLALCVKESDPETYYDQIYPRLRGTFYDAYVLLEPHKGDMGRYDVADDCIEKWWNGGNPSKASVSEWMTESHKGASSMSKATIYSNPQEVIKAICTARQACINAGNLAEKVTAIERAYSDAKIISAFPAGAFEDKLAIDDTRFWLDIHVRKYAGADSDRVALNHVLNRLGDAMHADKPRRFVTNTPILTKIGATDDTTLVDCFITSAFFISGPFDVDDQAKLSTNQSTKFTPFDDTFYNPLFGVMKFVDHREPYSGGVQAGRIGAALKRAGVSLTSAQMSAFDAALNGDAY